MPPKHRHQPSVVLNGVSERAISRLSSRFTQAQGGQPVTRRSLAVARDAQLEPCIDYLKLPLIGGGEFTWPVASLPRLVQQLTRRCPGYRSVLQEALQRHPAGPAHRWHFVLYLDEVVPGNVLAPDNRRNIMAFYGTFREVDADMFNEACWLPLGVLRRSIVDTVIGSWSAVMSTLLNNLLLGPTSMVSGGIDVAVPEIHTIFCDLSNILADEVALHCVWGNTGSSGLFPCLLCRNVVSGSSQLGAHDGSGTLVSISCPSYARLQLNSDRHIWAMADELAASAPTSTKAAQTTKNISLASTSTGVDCSTTDSFDLWPPATTCTFDPMHVFYVSGIVNFELHLLIGCIHTKLGLGYPELHEACQVAWVWPRWVSATCVKDIFTARRARHNHESFRASASELLACCPIVRLWLHSVVVPTGVAREQVQSCLALFAVLDLVDSLKFDFNPDVALELQRAVEHFLGLHAVAYGEEGMKPKHHMAHHIAPQILRDGMYMDCFTMERKNKAIKSCASHHCRPDHKFEASVLGRVLVEQADQLLQCSHPGLRGPQRDPEVAVALGVASCSTSDTMRCGRRKLSAGMVAFFSRQALLVQACAEADGVLLALGEPLVQCPSPSETASTWQRGQGRLVAVPFASCGHIGKCWRELSDGTLLVLGRWC